MVIKFFRRRIVGPVNPGAVNPTGEAYRTLATHVDENGSIEP